MGNVNVALVAPGIFTPFFRHWYRKGGVPVDSASLSVYEKEKLCRGWVQQMWRNIGPRQDVPAPDVGTTPQMMGWMMDEYSKLTGHYTPVGNPSIIVFVDLAK